MTDYFNGHYDFRPLGQPLGEDVLPEAITACEQILAGTANVEVKPSAFPGAPIQHIVKIGRTNISFDPDGIFEPKKKDIQTNRSTTFRHSE